MSKLLTNTKINGLELKNRMVVSAMVSSYANEDGTATEKYISYHERKAKGGWGLIITEDYPINPEAGGFKKLPGLWDDSQITSHQQLTKRVHEAGGKIAAQIYHAGRETGSFITGVQPVAPSAIKDPTMPETPRALSVEEIHQLVEQFGDCARRVKEAGFDGVEVHGASGYLVGQFVSPFSNKRFDQYGGTIENRARFAMEIVKDIRKKTGADFPILYRMSVQEYVTGGLGIEESKAIAILLENAGVDCIHCSQGVYASVDVMVPTSAFPRACFVDNAAAIKQVVSIPVIAVGRINDPLIAESILKSGKADLVTMARSSLADPELPNKYRDGKTGDIIRCIGCVQGCTGENGKGNSVRCLVNPMTGMEDEYTVTKAPVRKKVAVVGGGVAGCEAAIMAATRGHSVTLYEKESQLGGQWILASIPIGKEEFNSFLTWQHRQLEQLGVTIKLNITVDKALIEKTDPDAVIIATGSKPAIVPIPGIDKTHVVTAHDVLSSKVVVGGNVVVIGGGLVGAETADHLAHHGCQVSIVEMLPQIVQDGEPAPTRHLLKRLEEKKVNVFTSTSDMEIADDAVSFTQNGERHRIEQVNHVVLAVGVRSDAALAEELKGSEIEINTIGDALKVKDGYLNIREGYEIGLTI